MNIEKAAELAEFVQMIAKMRLWGEIEDRTDIDEESWLLDSDRELERIVQKARDLVKE